MNLPTDFRDMQLAPQPMPQEEEIFNLRAALATVLDYWGTALAVFLAGVLWGAYKVWVTPPLYQATALVEVETRSSGFAVGPESFNPSSYYWMPQAISAQIEILKSRSILAAAAEQMGLTIQAAPLHRGVIGAAMARSHRAGSVAPAPWFIPGAGRYAWGGESIEVAQFEVPEALLGRTFTLTAGEGGSYTLSAEGPLPGTGRIGEASAFSVDGHAFQLRVAGFEARPGTEFTLRRLAPKDAADWLRGRMSVSERGAKGAFSGSGILEIAVRASEPGLAADAANAIATTYLRTNVERLSETAERKLEFLNSQLPRLSAELEAAEQVLLEHRTRAGAYQLSEGAQSILDALTVLEREVSEVELQQAELSQSVTSEHPAMEALSRKLGQLQSERARINARIAALPDAESRLLQLTRNAKVAGELYISLLNKAQELRIAKAGTIGNVHIVDSAVPERGAVEPRVSRLLTTWTALGLVGAIAAVFLRKHLNVKLEWAEDAERRIGIPVYATIPHSPRQEQLDARGPAQTNGSRELLVVSDPQDIAVESLRSLRASLHFAMMEAKRNLVVVTGSTPFVGKSFVAANLARLIADSGRKVLLVDADLRKGRVHRMLNLPRSPGLSEAISGQVPRAEARQEAGHENFRVMTSGKLPPNPAELLASERFVSLVEEACKEFDLVILDTPPVLNLADGIIIARSAGAVFVTVRAGTSTVPDVQDCVARFAKNGIKVDGLIFNDLKPRIGAYIHPSYHHYRYRYRAYGDKA